MLIFNIKITIKNTLNVDAHKKIRNTFQDFCVSNNIYLPRRSSLSIRKRIFEKDQVLMKKTTISE